MFGCYRFYGLSFICLKNKFLAYGNSISKANKIRFREINSLLKSKREIMVGGGYKFLQKDFEKSSEKFSRLIGRTFSTLLAPIFIESLLLRLLFDIGSSFCILRRKKYILNEIFPLIIFA